MMLARPDIRPDIRDNEGKTPLWHALSCMREEHRASTSGSSGSGTSDGGHFQGFLTASIEALCAHGEVDPDKYPTRERQSSADLAAEVVQIYNRRKMGGSGSCKGGDADTAAGAQEHAGGGKAAIRAMTKMLGPAERKDTGDGVKRKRRRRRRRRRASLTIDTLPECLA